MSVPVLSYVLRLKEKSVGVEGEPSAVPPAQQEPDVATDPPEADPKSPVAKETKKKKKAKKN